jgi:hypothetical protein
VHLRYSAEFSGGCTIADVLLVVGAAVLNATYYSPIYFTGSYTVPGAVSLRGWTNASIAFGHPSLGDCYLTVGPTCPRVGVLERAAHAHHIVHSNRPRSRMDNWIYTHPSLSVDPSSSQTRRHN